MQTSCANKQIKILILLIILLKIYLNEMVAVVFLCYNTDKNITAQCKYMQMFEFSMPFTNPVKPLHVLVGVHGTR